MVEYRTVTDTETVTQRFTGIEDIYTLAAEGAIPSAIKGTRLGRSLVVPYNSNIILSNATSVSFPINYPSTPSQLRVVSTSANDSSSSYGVQQIAIEYITAPPNAEKKTEILNMNGVTPVATVNTDIFRIDRFRSNKTGAGLFSQGTISLQSTDGKTTYEKIDPMDNSFRTAIHYVPKNYKSFLTDLVIGCSTVGGVQFSLIIFEEFEDTVTPGTYNPILIAQREFEVAANAISVSLQQPVFVSNTTGNILGFVITVLGRASNQSASGSFAFVDIPI